MSKINASIRAEKSRLLRQIDFRSIETVADAVFAVEKYLDGKRLKYDSDSYRTDLAERLFMTTGELQKIEIAKEKAPGRDERKISDANNAKIYRNIKDYEHKSEDGYKQKLDLIPFDKDNFVWEMGNSVKEIVNKNDLKTVFLVDRDTGETLEYNLPTDYNSMLEAIYSRIRGSAKKGGGKQAGGDGDGDGENYETFDISLNSSFSVAQIEIGGASKPWV